MKRILIALDPDQDTPVATEYGITLAKNFNASVTGLAVVDTSNIYPSGIVGEPDYTHHARNLWEELTDEARKVAEKLLVNFEKHVKDEGVRYTSIKKEGASYKRIIEGMKYHDLLVIGRDSHFFYNEPNMDTKTLAQVVKNGVCPTLMVTDTYRELNHFLIATDGSSPSARSLKSFAQLFGKSNSANVELLTVLTKHNRNTDVIQYASDYLKEYNIKITDTHVIEESDPSDAILSLQQNIGADCTVMGAHAVSALKRLTFGSTTHDLITTSDTPLFLSP